MMPISTITDPLFVEAFNAHLGAIVSSAKTDKPTGHFHIRQTDPSMIAQSLGTEDAETAALELDYQVARRFRELAGTASDPVGGANFVYYPYQYGLSQDTDLLTALLSHYPNVMQLGSQGRLAREWLRNTSIRGRPLTIIMPDNMPVRNVLMEGESQGAPAMEPVPLANALTIVGASPTDFIFWLPQVSVGSITYPCAPLRKTSAPTARPGSDLWPVSEGFSLRLVLRPKGLTAQEQSQSVPLVGRMPYTDTSARDLELALHDLVLWQAHINVEAANKGFKAPSIELDLYPAPYVTVLEGNIESLWQAKVQELASAESDLAAEVVPQSCS